MLESDNIPTVMQKAQISLKSVTYLFSAFMPLQVLYIAQIACAELKFSGIMSAGLTEISNWNSAYWTMERIAKRI